MRRQIDPDFFKDPEPQSHEPGDWGEKGELMPSWAAIHKLQSDMESLSQAYKKVALRISQMESRWEERHLSVLKKVEKLTHGLQRSESYLVQFRKDVAQMAQDLRQRVSDRRISDARLEDLLERHNSVLQQFEVRIMGLQKHLQDKDLQLINYAEGLKEARKEMARLRAMVSGGTL